MNNLSDVYFFEIGTIIDTHGFKGELLIHFTQKLETLKEKELFFVLIDGIYVPFFVEETFKKSKARYAVKFRDIEAQENAVELINCTVSVSADNILPEEPHENSFLIGYRLFDNDIYIGKVTDFLSMSANDLLEVFHEEKQKHVLVPYHLELIKSLDEKNQAIYCILPEGLLDIND